MFITHKTPEKRYVLLSFDVEPVDGELSVMDVLDVIYRTDTSATFFVTGEYAAEYPHMVRLMSGREVASHGYTHSRLTSLDVTAIQDELNSTRQLLRKLSGQDIIGFRAPYNIVDKRTLDILEETGYTYDASMIGSWGLLYPKVPGSLGEIPISSIFGIPLEDVIWLYYLRSPATYFYILDEKELPVESYLFHPHHIATHKKEFEKFINYLKGRGVIFISHRELTELDNGGS
ncbi:MAG: polysaccharide deacetylase family protein [Candidatus Woesearchaeota archaeon]